MLKNVFNPYLYADDSKLLKSISVNFDHSLLESGMSHVIDWCNKWGMSLNLNKCKVISFHNKYTKPILYEYKYKDKNDFVTIFSRVDIVSDLGIVFDSELSFNDHIYNKINMANKMLGIIK